MSEEVQNTSLPEGLTKHERRRLRKELSRQERAKQERVKTITKVVLAVLGGIVTLGGGFLLIKEITKPLPGQFVASLGNQHIESVTTLHDPYNSLPPTSGPHVGGIAKWGIHNQPIPDELQIHNLEDGGVVVQYNCSPGAPIRPATPSAERQEECQELVTKLAEIVTRYNDKVILAPYPALDTKIALTAWTRIDKFEVFDKDRIGRFIDAFRGIDHHKG